MPLSGPRWGLVRALGFVEAVEAVGGKRKAERVASGKGMVVESGVSGREGRRCRGYQLA